MPVRVAIYARYSIDLQTERSIEDQVALGRRIIREEGLTEAGVFADRIKTSATLHGRSGLINLMRAVEEGKIDVVLVECLDRISRDPADFAGLYKRLRFHGVMLREVHGGEANAITVGVRGLMGSLFLTDLKDKVRRGLAGNVSRGASAGGKAYGYEPVLGKPGELCIVAAEAAVVLEIFERYLAGETPREIAHSLNERGVLAPRGARWNASTLNGSADRGYGILRNGLYNGLLIWNRVRMDLHPDTGKRVSRINSDEEWRSTSVEHLRIVPRELFEAVQRRLDDRSRAQASGTFTRKAKRPFSGILVCGVCGGGMSIHDRTGGAIRIRCSTARESGSCPNTGYYRLDRIEQAVIGHLAEHLAQPAYADAYIREYRKETERETADARRDRAKLERDVSHSRSALDRLIHLYTSGVIDGADAEARVREAKDRVRIAEAALAKADPPTSVVELHPDATRLFSRSVDALLQSLGDPEPSIDPSVLSAIRLLIAKIIVEPDGEGDITIEVRGNLAALLNPHARVGGAMVAEEGLEPPTRGL
jgi:site-specific DNA recombinase